MQPESTEDTLVYRIDRQVNCNSMLLTVEESHANPEQTPVLKKQRSELRKMVSQQQIEKQE